MKESLQEIIQHSIRPLFQIEIGDFVLCFSSTLVASFVAGVLFLAVFVSIGVAVQKGKPKSLAIVGEIIYLSLRTFMRSMLGDKGDQFAPFIGALFGYILFSNLLGLFSPLGGLGLHWIVSPNIDLSCTLALATVGILYVHTVSIRGIGFKKWLHHFIEPYVFMLPIKIVEEIVKPISLSVRLFGNLFGEHVVYEIVFYLISFVVPVLLIFLGMFTGIVQAYVFSLLVLIYIKETMGVHT
ncbi:MAG: F0F1 ATP synthase subunit A [Caldisericia bacterium]|nr:F0F1 ATP synthase subunit A [Caldisericia bacterium]MDD4614379.1 F0F1 ATP synthase subunit A [Caldisericia bacterium]